MYLRQILGNPGLEGLGREPRRKGTERKDEKKKRRNRQPKQYGTVSECNGIESEQGSGSKKFSGGGA